MPDTFARWFDAHEAALDAEIAADTRRDLLRQARDRLDRAARCERWGMVAMDYCDQAADALRRAGLPELADEVSDEFGCDVAAVLRELERKP